MKEKVKKFLKENSKDALGLEPEKVKVLDKLKGAYNLNYPVQVNGEKFLFRISPLLEGSSKEYEYKVLKLLEKKKLAPKPYFVDTSCGKIKYPFLIEGWIEGESLEELSMEDMDKLAELFYRINSTEPKGLKDKRLGPKEFVKRISWDLNEYTHKGTFNVDLFYDLEEFVPPVIEYLEGKEKLFEKYANYGLSNTDIKPEHIIRTGDGLRVVDWEFAGRDDSSHDIGEFFYHAKWRNIGFNDEKKRRFLEKYRELSSEKRLEERIEVRMAVFAVNETLWFMKHISDLKSESFPSSMKEGDTIEKYRKAIERNFDWLNEKLNLELELR